MTEIKEMQTHLGYLPFPGIQSCNFFFCPLMMIRKGVTFCEKILSAGLVFAVHLKNSVVRQEASWKHIRHREDFLFFSRTLSVAATAMLYPN